MIGNPKSLAALLFPIETDGVRVYTIADCYPDPFGVAITKRFEPYSHVASGGLRAVTRSPHLHYGCTKVKSPCQGNYIISQKK